MTGFPAETWWLFVLLTIGPQIAGHTVFNYLLGHLEASVVAIAVMAEPVGATLLALAILGEGPSAATIAGGVLILAGIYLAIARSNRPELLESPVD